MFEMINGISNDLSILKRHDPLRPIFDEFFKNNLSPNERGSQGFLKVRFNDRVEIFLLDWPDLKSLSGLILRD